MEFNNIIIYLFKEKKKIYIKILEYYYIKLNFWI